ncbi:MAG: Amuc_1100 family pilus-like protein [Verrucomicrobiae bacterium]|nr:Amuc_1100 family pilus-like protein [Verrucomicrobiae bacterium]
MNWKKLLGWLKNNVGLTLGAVISLAGLGWLSYQLWIAYDNAATAASELERMQTDLNRMRARKPFPHPENIAILSNTVATLSGSDPELSVSNWLERLSAASVPAAPIQAPAFAPLLLRQSSALVAEARKQGVGLPEKFGFGFGLYLNAGRAVTTNTTEISNLLTQWNTIEALTRLLISNRVARIDGIARARCASEMSRDGTPGVSGSSAAAAAEEFTVAPLRDRPEEIMRVLPFELDFTCGNRDSRTANEILRDVLNALGRTPQFFIVRSVSLVSSRLAEIEAGGRTERERTAGESVAAPPMTPDGTMPPSAPAPGAPVPGAPGKPAGPVRLDKPIPVFGLESIRVKVRVDLVQFRKATAAPAPAVAPKKSKGR